MGYFFFLHIQTCARARARTHTQKTAREVNELCVGYGPTVGFCEQGSALYEPIEADFCAWWQVSTRIVFRHV